MPKPEVQEGWCGRVYSLARPDGSTLLPAYFNERHAREALPAWSRALGVELRVVSWPVEEDSMVITEAEEA